MNELQLKIIQDNPIGEGLSSFRNSFPDALERLEQLSQEGEK
jgi:hypothetical protein